MLVMRGNYSLNLLWLGFRITSHHQQISVKQGSMATQENQRHPNEDYGNEGQFKILGTHCQSLDHCPKNVYGIPRILNCGTEPDDRKCTHHSQRNDDIAADHKHNHRSNERNCHIGRIDFGRICCTQMGHPVRDEDHGANDHCRNQNRDDVPSTHRCIYPIEQIPNILFGHTFFPFLYISVQYPPSKGIFPHRQLVQILMVQHIR